MGSIPTPGTSLLPRARTGFSLMPPTSAFSAGTVLAVALGGAIGSTLRFGTSELIRRAPGLSGWPWVTLAVNIVGSFLLGWFLRWSATTETAPALRAFVAVGICGGFTTFSAFAAENFAFLEAGQPGRALLHATASVTLSVGAVYLGYLLARP